MRSWPGLTSSGRFKLAVILILAAATAGAAPATITPTATAASCTMAAAPPASSAVGAQTHFDVVISSCLDVAGASFKIGFNSTINLDSYVLGSTAFPPRCSPAVNSIDNSGHFANFACITLPLTGANDGGGLASYLYTCQAEGSSSLTFQTSALSDHQAHPIAHAALDGKVTCTAAPTNTPGPSPTPTITPGGPTLTPTHTPKATSETPTQTSTPTSVGPTVTPTATGEELTATPTLSGELPTATPTSEMPTSTPTPTRTRTPTPDPADLVGDANKDGYVNAIDAELVLQSSAGLISSINQNADANHNGQINAIDATLILQYVAGLLSNLPP
jgi:hypothetical protein